LFAAFPALDVFSIEFARFQM